MKIRLRAPSGQKTVELPEDATVGDLWLRITEETSLRHYDVRYGYPPRPLNLKGVSPSSKLRAIGLKLDNEQLILSESTNSPSSRPKSTAAKDLPKSELPSETSKAEIRQPIEEARDSRPETFSFDGVGTAPTQQIRKPAAKPNKPLSLNRKSDAMTEAPEVPVPHMLSTMILRIMPDDNSCLFRAFNTAVLGSSIDSMHELRSIIAQYIQAHPEIYSEAVLDQKVDDYCRWIQTDDAWGGNIELDILSKHFDIEICSIDVQTLRVDHYNEGRDQRCMLVYSGIHYDTIALSPSDPPHTQAYAPPDFDTKVVESSDGLLLAAAVELCAILKERHYYTDTAGFQARCNVCGSTFTGEKGATQHASETGHMDFGET